ncbi:hypothetical protein PR002_g9252 [Phytophthora rubi]|uniref:Uncharacterized protein n=1 Tax=Phytophthora rubi TaxID=129364 RepID=A0A6A3ML68_9STRA|nr:hypothetical protein PR002_g9252 [Phytophthora rubi]
MSAAAALLGVVNVCSSSSLFSDSASRVFHGLRLARKNRHRNKKPFSSSGSGSSAFILAVQDSSPAGFEFGWGKRLTPKTQGA